MTFATNPAHATNFSSLFAGCPCNYPARQGHRPRTANAPCPARTAADSDSVRREIDREPPFGIYKDNYFVTGSSFSHGGPNKYNSDAKFQISLRYRLIQGVLPYNTYLFLTYTQKSFWEIYRKSKPFSDNNYNPTLGWATCCGKMGKRWGW